MVTVQTRAAPNTTSFHAEARTSPPPVGAQAPIEPLNELFSATLEQAWSETSPLNPSLA